MGNQWLDELSVSDQDCEDRNPPGHSSWCKRALGVQGFVELMV